MRFIFLFIVGCGVVGTCAAQIVTGPPGAARVDTLVIARGGVARLHPFVVKGSVEARRGATTIDSTAFRVDYRFGHFSLNHGPTEPDTLIVAYRVIPILFEDVYKTEVARRMDTTAAQPMDRRYRTQLTASPVDIFGGSRLQKSGSITRGVIAGNNQDATIESGLRMQLSGEIVDGVELRAVLTDENTPILPEGTTQRINEFDRVFIEVKSARGDAQLGDFELAMHESEFARFDRKLQGGRIHGVLPASSGVYRGGTVMAAGATSRGVFRSQEFSGVEGVQGPYRLEGLSGERFIIVVPGTENVFIDGLRLTRGETNDYVIDYATAEITFTPQRIITGNKRIVVEFQYTTNQFTRTLLASQVSSRFGSERREAGSLSVTFIREADSREFNREFGLTSNDSLLISQSGDRPASRSGAEAVTYNPEAPYVQYVRETTTLPGGAVDTIFVAVTSEPDSNVTVFRVQFSRVGQGNGRYVRSGRSVNGILYEFRGAGLGEYEPIRLLPKPKLQQLFDVAAAVSPLEGVEVFGEWARSINNENRLSPLDAGDDGGGAYTVGARMPALNLGGDGVSVSIEARRRFVDANFRSFNRIRQVEFGRRWNLASRQAGAAGGNSIAGNETTTELEGNLAFSKQTRVSAEWGEIELADVFSAVRRGGTLQLDEVGWPGVNYSLEYITSNDRGRSEAGKWLRHTGRIAHQNLIGRLTPAVEVEHEDRRQRDVIADSLLPVSLGFVEVRPSLTWSAERLDIGSSADIRKDALVIDNGLHDAATGWTLRAFLRYRGKGSFNTDADIGFRRLDYRDRFRIEQGRQNSESIVLRWKGGAQPLRRAVNASWFYEAQTERTPKLQEIYVRTGAELGQYVWVDANSDGAIQIDEFLPETTPNEGNYVKTFVPSDSLFSIIGVQARLRLGFEPDKLLPANVEGLGRLLRQVSLRTTLEVVEKTRDQRLSDVYLLRLNRFRVPGKTLNGRLVVRQDVTLFKTNPDYGVDATFNQVRGLTDLSAGLEQRFVNLWQVSGMVRPARRLTLRVTASTEINRVTSASFRSREFDLRNRRLIPELSYSPSRSWHVKVSTDLAHKIDRRFDRSAFVTKVPVEVRYNRARRLQATGRFEVANIRLDGSADGFAQFELTDGRGPGTSTLWAAGAQYAINQYIRADLSYDGRAPANAPALHTLRMQVTAIF